MAKSVKPFCATCVDPKPVHECQEIAHPIHEDECCKTGVMVVCPHEKDVPHESPCCEEKHCGCKDKPRTEKCKLWVGTLESFNWPACQGTATIRVDDAHKLNTGHQLHSEGVGYLTVESVLNENTVVVRNDCLVEGGDGDCNSISSGESVSCGTRFNVGIPACVGQITNAIQQTGVFLCSDFVIPAVDNPISIKVTTVDGLSINDRVSISGYEYVVTGISDATTITISNAGSGGPVGTLIEDDETGDGVKDHPIVRIGGEDPCLAEEVNEADAFIVCENGQQRPAVGTAANQIWQWDGSKWSLRVIPELDACTTLTADFVAEPLNEVTIACLADTSICSDDNVSILIIDGREYFVEEILDDEKVRLRRGFDLSTSVLKIPAGTAVCCGDCCAACLEPFTEVTANPYGLDQFVDIGTGPGPIEIGCSNDIVIENKSCKPVNYFLYIQSQLSLDIKAGGIYSISTKITEDGVEAGPNGGPTIGSPTADIFFPYIQPIPIWSVLAAGEIKTFSVCHCVDIFTPSAGSQVLNGSGVIGSIFGTGLA